MSHHIVPVKTYALVFLALLGLLAVSVIAAQIEHGPLNLIVGLSIAVLKAALIVLVFMHISHSTFVIRMAAAAGLVWLAILITITMSDYMTRDWTAATRIHPVRPAADASARTSKSSNEHQTPRSIAG